MYHAKSHWGFLPVMMIKGKKLYHWGQGVIWWYRNNIEYPEAINKSISITRGNKTSGKKMRVG